MRCLILGVERRSGTAKATGRPYDFVQVHGALPVEPMSRENFALAGFGFRPIALRADPGVEKIFETLKFPGEFDLDMQNDIGMDGEVSAKLVGLKAVK